MCLKKGRVVSWASFVLILFFPISVKAAWSDGILGVSANGTTAVDVTYTMPVDDGTESASFDRTGCSSGIRDDGTSGGNVLFSYLHYYTTEGGSTTGTQTGAGYFVSPPLTVGVATDTYSWTISGLPNGTTIDGAGMLCATPAVGRYQWPLLQADLIRGTTILHASAQTYAFDSTSGTAATGQSENWLQYNTSIAGTQIAVLDFVPAEDMTVCSVTTPLRVDGSLFSPAESFFAELIELNAGGTAQINSISDSDNVVSSDVLPLNTGFFDQTFNFSACPHLIGGNRYGIRMNTTNPSGINTSPNGNVLRWMQASNNNWTTPLFTAQDNRFREDSVTPGLVLGTQIGAVSMSSAPLAMQMTGTVGGGSPSWLIQQTYDGPLTIMDKYTATSTSFFSDLYSSSTQALCDEFGSAFQSFSIGGFGGALADCVVDIVRYLFVPNQTALGAFKTSADALASRAPFGYASQIASSTRAIFIEQSTSSTEVGMLIPPRPYTSSTTTTLAFFNTATVQQNVEPLISPIRAVVSVLLWFAFFVGLYEFAVHHARPE